jgi:hypothetical protein
MSDDKIDALNEVAYSARQLLQRLRESYDVGDLDEDVDEAIEELENKLVELDENDSESDGCEWENDDECDDDEFV